MNLSSSSPAFLLIYVALLLCILMDVDFRTMSRRHQIIYGSLFLFVIIGNHFLKMYLGDELYDKTILFTMHLPYFMLFLHITKCGITKMVFMILTALVFSTPSVVISNIVIHITSSDFLLFVVNIATYIVCLAIAYFAFRKGFNFLIKHADSKVFVLFSVVPVVFYMYVFAFMKTDVSTLGYTPAGLIVRYSPVSMTVLFYIVVMYVFRLLYDQYNNDLEQSAMKYALDAADNQIAHLNENQKQIAIYHHDMRHHLNVIDGFLKSKAYDKAESYINEVSSTVNQATAVRYCENDLVNILCSSFARKAVMNDVRLELDIQVPSELPLNNTEICAVLSNTFENALKASLELDKEMRKIQVFAGVRMGRLMVEVKNNYKGYIKMQNGIPVSNKSGHGFGVRSIVSIAKKYGGFYDINTDNGVFELRFLVPMNKNAR